MRKDGVSYIIKWVADVRGCGEKLAVGTTPKAPTQSSLHERRESGTGGGNEAAENYVITSPGTWAYNANASTTSIRHAGESQ